MTSMQLPDSPAFKGHLLGVTQGLIGYTVSCLRCDFRQDFTPEQIEKNPHVSEAIPALGPCPNCPTCSGPNRETVGLVCQTCGKDYGLPMDGTPEQLTDAESLGVLVAGVVQTAQAERDQARDIAVNLEQQLAQAMVHLTRCLAVLAEQGTTFAADSRAVVQANEFLEGLRSVETPEAGATT